MSAIAQDVPVHACPEGDSATTTCCGRSPFELTQDRITTDPALVTCRPAPKHGRADELPPLDMQDVLALTVAGTVFLEYIDGGQLPCNTDTAATLRRAVDRADALLCAEGLGASARH